MVGGASSKDGAIFMVSILYSWYRSPIICLSGKKKNNFLMNGWVLLKGTSKYYYYDSQTNSNTTESVERKY
jgi:hypothetical protein